MFVWVINGRISSKELHICHYWCFKNVGFKYEPYLCNGCHVLMQKDMNFNDTEIIYFKGSAYRTHFDAINIMNNSNLID